MTPRIGSLCTGYGGLDMAVQQVFGGTVAWHSQYEPPDKDGREDTHQYAAQILAHHWPDIPNHGDLTAINFRHVEPVDILTAGFPCQDVSLAGRRAGLAEGTRSGLWRHVARAVAELRPRLVVIENVPGLLSAPADGDVEPCTWCVGDVGDEPLLRALGAVLADLARLGFDAEWGVLGASAVGAPHQRRRVILLAWPADAASAGRPREGLQRRVAERGAAPADADGVGGERDRARSGRRDEPAAHHLPAADEPRCPTCECGEWMHDAGGFCAGCHNCTDPELGRPDDAAADPARVGEREPADQADAVAGSGDAREMPGRRGGTSAADPDSDAVREQPVDVGRGCGTPVARLAGANAAAHADRGGLQGDQEPAAGRIAVQQRVRDDLDGRDGPAAGTSGNGRDEGRTEPAGQQRGPDTALGGEQGVAWGEYEPAVRRWESILGRSAPRPTDALGRLDPPFVEWMQGLPAGHVTGVPGLPRGAQLKALGNGVVPQQAAAAIRLLADRTSVFGLAS
ncbi:DNA cytosine methyltransferase [Streptomyces acidiscabies]|uniref:DNA (cytosine-5-)-methyltransferase n=1 Tax=Streptomyces acidiscabies TaxID=42234 RepID=A0AAP6BKV0_9ACTN|nr:DNA cytosine methyltransferase [Streptomyces acidiscabies]MDX2966624.1 DNA cytosine methyltransferase [Streptomyces acidiscabies]MDX3796594.1 DNA cytosine methyltransferase [Streptomyces acidiscabies]